MIIEGKNAVRQAIETDKTINTLFVQNGQADTESVSIIRLARENGIKITFCDRMTLNQKSATKRHQGFIAEVTDFEYCDIDDMINEDENQLIVVLDQIKDPHNFGAIIRSCECFGANGIVIAKNRCVPVNDTVIKTSTGAISGMKIARVTNINKTIEDLKKEGFWVYGAEIGGHDITKTNLKGKIAIVVGSEGEGISRLTKEKCDEIITIPMHGKINSLNASVACAVALYEVRRQRDV